MRISAATLAPEMNECELLELLSVVRAADLRGPHLEIGTAAGGTLRELMRIYTDEQRPAFVVVDPLTYFPNQRETIEDNLRQAGLHPEHVDFRQGLSWPLFLSTSPKESFSFIFIDGDHSAEGVMRDLAWTRLLEVGGIVALHDYGPKFPGVVWATDRFLSRYPNYEKLTQLGCLIVLRKNAVSQTAEVTAFDIGLAGWLRRFLRFKRSIRKRLPRWA